MPVVDAVVECPVHDSFRVQQVAGMFDVPPADRCRERFSVEVPGLDEEWSLGMIVGPSGSGKSTIARAAFGRHVCERGGWPQDQAVVDGFGERSIREITGALTAVGFSSPPSWIKPYGVLSQGEQFRCDLARALLTAGPLVVFDEFTSVVDRTVARLGSAAVADAVRRGRFDARFVAVTCHYDVLEWLAPDWWVDMATSTLARGCLRRPPIRLEVVRCAREAWRMFARHHYLSGSLSAAAECYLATWNDEPVAFCALVGMYGKRGAKRITRLVVLPDYQGLGVGLRLAETVCRLQGERGVAVGITASHPAVIAHCRRSNLWRTVAVRKTGGRVEGNFFSRRGRPDTGRPKGSAGRAVVSFAFEGDAEGSSY